MILAAARAALAPYLLWIKLALIAAAAGAIVVAVIKHDARIASAADAAGYNRRVAEEVSASVAAAFATDRRDALAAQATRHFHAQLNAELPQVEESSHATQERIRIVYRDHPVPVACVRPAGVLQQLDAARARANAAAGAPAH